MSSVIEPPKIYFLNVWTRIRPELPWGKFMKALVIHINRLPIWSGCLEEPVFVRLPWCLIFSSNIRGVKNVNGLMIYRWCPLMHPIIEPWSFRGWELDFICQINPRSSNDHRFVLAATDYFIKWTEAILLKNMIHSRVIYILRLVLLTWDGMADIQYRPRKRHDWCVSALHCFSAILSFQRYFLVRKLYKETERHKLTLKIGATQVFSEFTDIYLEYPRFWPDVRTHGRIIRIPGGSGQLRFTGQSEQNRSDRLWKPVRPVWKTLSNFQLDRTIA